MKYRKSLIALRWLAPCFALLLAGLRVMILKTAFDEAGLLPRGSWALLATVLACACCFCLLWLFCVKLNRRPGREKAFSVRVTTSREELAWWASFSWVMIRA